MGRNKSTNSKWVHWFGMGSNLVLCPRTLQKWRDFQGSPQSDLRVGIPSWLKKLCCKVKQLWYTRSSTFSISEARVGFGTPNSLSQRPWASSPKQHQHLLFHLHPFNTFLKIRGQISINCVQTDSILNDQTFDSRFSTSNHKFNNLVLYIYLYIYQAFYYSFPQSCSRS